MRRFSQFVTVLLFSTAITRCAGPTSPTPLAGTAASPGASTANQTPDASAGDLEVDILAGARTSRDIEEARNAAEGVSSSAYAVRAVARYFAAAASGGFNRDDSWGISYGTSYQGVLNTAKSNCERYTNTGCEHVAICGPSNGLSASRPFVAFARSSVYRASYLERGATGVACGYTSASAAANAAVAQCRLLGCVLKWAGRVA